MKIIRAKQVKVHIAYVVLHDQYGIIAKKLNLTQTTILMWTFCCSSRRSFFNREFKQIATAGAATAIVVDEVWGEYVAVARQNSTLSNAKYK